MDMKIPVDSPQMGRHGTEADSQIAGDLFGKGAVGQQFRDFFLAGGRLGRIRVG